MEASMNVFRRRFLNALVQAGRCDCHTAPTHASRSPHLRAISQTRSPTIRTFSSTTKRWLEEVSEPDMKISNSVTHPSSPAQTTPKQELQNYITLVQKVIDGYQLNKRENLHERLHSNMVVALSNAEASLNAPGAASESFDPVLRSLQAEITPVLQNRFNTANVSQIVADIGKPSSSSPQKPAATTTRLTAVADMLDQTFGESQGDEKKFSALKRMNFDSPGLRGAFTTGGTVNAALASQDRMSGFDRTAQHYDAFQAAKSKGPTLRLTSSLGKSVEVTGGTDLTRAFQKMEMICGRNAVKRDLASQRFHVRRGQLKKQNRMARWRRLFKEGFIAECGRVRRMRRQGW